LTEAVGQRHNGQVERIADAGIPILDSLSGQMSESADGGRWLCDWQWGVSEVSVCARVGEGVSVRECSVSEGECVWVCE
jgi:hypothetical protein